jgi:transcriptional regulator with XRE-family HTH domain
MEDRQMKHPDDRMIARLMASLEGHAAAGAGHSFDLAAGQHRFMAWLQEGGDQAGDEKAVPGPAASGERLAVSQLGYSPRVLRIVLGGRLRRLREAVGVTRHEAGYEIRCSGSKISRMELGRTGFRQRDVSDLLDLYGVTGPDERDELLDLARQANEADDEKEMPGTAASRERLGVSQLGYSPRVLRLLLGGRLRRLREAAAVTRDEAGWEIRCSGSKISRMELGRTGFKERDVSDLLDLYGVTGPHERDELLYLVRQANEPPWWRDYADILPEWFEPYLALEEGAAEIRAYEAQHVPELLQTEDYARALAWLASPRAADWEIDRRLQLLKERQAALARPGAPRLRALIDEAALRRPVGGTDVMHDQYRYLAEASRLPGTTIQVVPLSSDTGSVAGCSFVVLRSADPDLPDVTYLPQLTSAIYLESAPEVARYMKALDVMAGRAEGPRTAAILRGLLKG